MAACYVEVFVLQNALVDACLLWLVAAWRGGRINPRRIVLGALLGAGYATAAALIGGTLRSVPFQAVVSVAMVCVALKSRPGRAVLPLSGVLWIGAALLGGALSMGVAAVPAIAFAGFAGMALLRRKHAPPPNTASLVIRQGEKTQKMEAIVDTGNRALDALTGLPVVFVEAGVFRPEPGRVLCIRTAAGASVVPCFLPDAISLDGKQVRAVVACCAKGSLTCALVPYGLCAEREAA